MQRLGLRYAARWQETASGGIPVWAHRSTARAVAVTGYEVILPLHLMSTGWIGTGTDSLEYSRVDSTGVLRFRREGVELFTLDLEAAVGDAVSLDSLQSVRGVPLAEPVVAETAGGGYRVRLVLDNFNGEIRNGRLVLTSASGYLLASGFR
jgi:hypothetical protein